MPRGDCRYLSATVRLTVEVRERHAHQRELSAGAFSRPHPIARATAAQEHVQKTVAAFEERKLIDRAA